ncbi:MAG: hypothetical protein L0271_25990 [Gemmatimonadetes bacterium]|nr:hypothetical protein [Gemmatimonadota bacterium]
MRFLHVLNGDAVADGLAGSDVPGTLAVWADVLHEGPVPPDDDLSAWLRIRADYLSATGLAGEDDALARLTLWQAALEAYLDYDEVILWFEHDLFDQLLLIRHLAWFARQAATAGGATLSGLPDGVALTLICIGAHPEVDPFHGLGQLSPDQLSRPFAEREVVTREQMLTAVSAWKAFTGTDPLMLERFAQQDPVPLPFLGAAFVRLLEEYPSVHNGLGRTEQQILQILAGGSRRAAEVFETNQRLEERVFMGDVTFWNRLRALAEEPAPLIGFEDPGPARAIAAPGRGVRELHRDSAIRFDADVALTAHGRNVVEARADRIELRGIDQWIGGVHMNRATPWRWDREARRLVKS